ncbi:ATP-binding protein [Massilia eurypsychrophila]|jgi:two-component system sensor histidine kinase TctE|uniref:histidine kinase n=1 Tax=Massilia eurypsychrophila TaxID=1485217 RepID=A0A2G8TIG4_9BURK|nr:HAMP domain-containing sensor histidine kinase [Massilia eurypsychrophila]PIL45837.1 ATP-binding protein [Massilia eurypsychrophila]
MTSIRLRLLKWLIGPILLVNVAGAALAAMLGWTPAQLRAEQDLSATIGALVALEALFTLVLVGLIWFSVTNGLQPLARLSAQLRTRDADDLAPVGAPDVPVELAPVVAAFDDLLAKLQAGASAQHDFLANVAHQLRTPLAGVKLQLEWLAARHGADADSVHSIRLMLLSNERMIRQTNQLLALARAEPSHFEKTRLEPLDLAALVEESIQHFVDLAVKNRIDLGFELAPVPIAGDRFLLRDLIDNLVDNALRYTPAQGTVTVSCYRDGKYGVLAVEDSGPGIALSQRERVFNRFVRLDDSTTGSGLGLAIVRDIALAHGASIAIDSRAAGEGAIFSVRFLS